VVGGGAGGVDAAGAEVWAWVMADVAANTAMPTINLSTDFFMWFSGFCCRGILEAKPNESSFLSGFFQKEAVIMKDIRRDDFNAKTPHRA
jgi:hypothetical protein